MSRVVDHARAAREFIADQPHLEFHDKRLWELKGKRDAQSQAVPEWDELRELASAIKEHTLTHLADHLEEFERNATKNGIRVHWARDGAEHNRIVHEILSARGATRLVKSKSMVTEECNLREFLEKRGVRVTETDLGERIQQLDGEMPSHIVIPAVHKLTGDVAKLFSEHFGTDPRCDDPRDLARAQRDHTRSLYLEADAGMTGANFFVAETGSIVVCTNEGNADLCTSVPSLHIASLGIERVLPSLEHVPVFVRMLSRSAIGTPITQYTSHFAGPRPDDPRAEMHVILLDNGRSARLGMEDYWSSLKCIRCGACMNACPVYRRSGGLSYGAVYSGPIGAIIDPTFDAKKYSGLPFASTLNGACSEVCPVKINIHEQLLKWRQALAKQHHLPFVKREAMRLLGRVMASPRLFRSAIAGTSTALEALPRFAIYNWLNPWGRAREIPVPPEQTFREWYLSNRGKS